MAGEREPASDVQRPERRVAWVRLWRVPRRGECWVETIRCASATISSHTSLSANALNGNLDTPVSLSSRIRSSTCACWRWPHPKTPMSSLGWSVRIAWKRYPSWSVNDSCAPGRAFTPHDQPAAVRPAGQIDHFADLCDLPVLALGSALGERRDPSLCPGFRGSRRGGARSARSRPRTASAPRGSNRAARAWRGPCPRATGSEDSRLTRPGSARAPGPASSCDQRPAAAFRALSSPPSASRVSSA